MTTNKDLKAWLDAKKRPTRVLGDVERYLLTREPEPRPTDVLHPSEIVKDDWCHRESYYLLLGHPKKQDRPALGLQNIFDEGHAIHHKWQSRFEDMGVLWGMWDNGPGSDTWWGFPGDGPSQHRRYREVPVKSSQCRVTGHGDGIVRGLGDPLWLEIKSIGEGTLRALDPSLLRKYPDPGTAWKFVNRPFRDHRRQTWFYMELWNMGVADHWFGEINEAVLIYEWKANQSVKEFVITRAPDMVADVFEGIEVVLKAVESGTPPPCNVDGCKKCSNYKEA